MHGCAPLKVKSSPVLGAMRWSSPGSAVTRDPMAGRKDPPYRDRPKRVLLLTGLNQGQRQLGRFDGAG